MGHHYAVCTIIVGAGHVECASNTLFRKKNFDLLSV